MQCSNTLTTYARKPNEKNRGIQTCNGVALRNGRRPFRLGVPEASEPCLTGSRSEGYSERMNLGLVTSRGPSLKSKSSRAHTAGALLLRILLGNAVGHSLNGSCGREDRARAAITGGNCRPCTSFSTVEAQLSVTTPKFKHKFQTIDWSQAERLVLNVEQPVEWRLTLLPELRLVWPKRECCFCGDSKHGQEGQKPQLQNPRTLFSPHPVLGFCPMRLAWRADTLTYTAIPTWWS